MERNLNAGSFGGPKGQHRFARLDNHRAAERSTLAHDNVNARTQAEIKQLELARTPRLDAENLCLLPNLEISQAQCPVTSGTAAAIRLAITAATTGRSKHAFKETDQPGGASGMHTSGIIQLLRILVQSSFHMRRRKS